MLLCLVVRDSCIIDREPVACGDNGVDFVQPRPLPPTVDMEAGGWLRPTIRVSNLSVKNVRVAVLRASD
jgi:hypothetical protein